MSCILIDQIHVHASIHMHLNELLFTVPTSVFRICDPECTLCTKKVGIKRMQICL